MNEKIFATITDSQIKINKNKTIKKINYIDFIELNSDYYKSKYIQLMNSISNIKQNNYSIYSLCFIDNHYNYWWMTKFYEKSNYKSRNITNIIKLIALVEIIENEKINKVNLKINNYEFYLAIKKTLYFKKITISKNIKFIFYLQSIFFKIKFIIKFITIPYYLLKFLIYDLKFKKTDNFYYKTTFFSYFTHFNYEKYLKNDFNSNQWGNLIELLREKKIKTNWFHHYIKDNLNINSRIASSKLNKFNLSNPSESHSFIIQRKNFYVYFLIFYTFFSKFFKNFNYFLLNKNVFNTLESNCIISPLIKDDLFDSFFGKTFIQNIFYIFSFDIICKNLPTQNKGFYFFENQPWEHALIQAWKKYNHKTLFGVVTSDVRYWDLRYFKNNNDNFYQGPNKILCNNIKSYDFLKKCNYELTEIQKIEANRYSNIFINMQKYKSRKLKSNLKFSLLFVGDYNHNNNKKIITLMSKFVDAYNKANVGYKPHPATQTAISVVNNKKIIIENDDILNLSNKYNIIIAYHTTNAALDAYILGFKTIIYLPDNELNFSSLRSYKDVSFIKSYSNLIQYFNKSKNDLKKTIKSKDYFWYENSLIKWRRILEN